MGTQLKQVERPIATKNDDELEVIDLTSCTAEENEDLSDLNKRITIKQPVKWWINDSGGWYKEYQDGSSDGKNKGIGKYRPLCCQFPRDTTSLWRHLSGQRVTPTQVSALLSQNPSGPSRSPSFCYKWDQPDEAYYIAKARAGLAEFRAETDSDYSYVSEMSDYRGLFRCPERLRLLEKRELISLVKRKCGGISTSSAGGDGGDFLDYGMGAGVLPGGVPDDLRGAISIYINPKTGQATWICPRCTHNNRKEFGGTGYPIYHQVTREMRTILEVDKIIPTKEYKYKDRTKDAPHVIVLVNRNPGISCYRIDRALNLPKGTAARLIEKELAGKVEVREKGKKGKKKSGVYPICTASFS